MQHILHHAFRSAAHVGDQQPSVYPLLHIALTSPTKSISADPGCDWCSLRVYHYGYILSYISRLHLRPKASPLTPGALIPGHGWQQHGCKCACVHMEI
eukprot:5725893-Pyramimonas_sp.AAC.4